MLGPDDEYGRQGSFEIPLDRSIEDSEEDKVSSDDEYDFKFK